ncbi:hypothetical protein IC582_002331 [Cucumis melo]
MRLRRNWLSSVEMREIEPKKPLIGGYCCPRNNEKLIEIIYRS